MLLEEISQVFEEYVMVVLIVFQEFLLCGSEIFLLLIYRSRLLFTQQHQLPLFPCLSFTLPIPPPWFTFLIERTFK